MATGRHTAQINMNGIIAVSISCASKGVAGLKKTCLLLDELLQTALYAPGAYEQDAPVRM